MVSQIILLSIKIVASLQSLFRMYRVFIRRNLERKCRILLKTFGFQLFLMFPNGFPVITGGVQFSNVSGPSPLTHEGGGEVVGESQLPQS